MPRPRTGSVFRHGDHWDIQITLPGGGRSRPMCQSPDMSEAAAREKALRQTKRAAHEALPGVEPKRRRKDAPAAAGDTFAEWSERWCDARAERGLTSVKDDRGRLRKWVLPSLGPKRMGEITRADLERLVEELDANVRASALAWRTARNTWAVVAKAFDDACRSKVLALRVLETNPAAGVRGPDEGVKQSKSYLYPSEFAALVSCQRVPLRWRRLFALAVYTYTRAGELEALEREDVDLRAGVLHVHRAIDRSEAGEVKETKTNNPRRIPIEPTLAPLLQTLLADGDGPRVIAMPPACDLSERLRHYLKWAGVERAELFANDRTRKQITFHDLRATGLTWMAIRGDDAIKIMRRAGHENMETTMGYVREAENLVHPPGEVFAALPAELVSPGESPEGPSRWAKLRETVWEKVASPAGYATLGIPRAGADVRHLLPPAPRERLAIAAC
jgi:integrase